MSIIYGMVILIAWFVEMPLWLSIVTTILSVLGIIFRLLYLGTILADKANNLD